MKIKNNSDVDIFMLIISNRKSGFDYLYKQYGCMLYGTALNAVQSNIQAEEIVQMTFIRIWKAIELYEKPKVSVKTWILQQLIISIKEFLTSKNIRYQLKTDNFPHFSFEQIKNTETSKIADLSSSQGKAI